MILPVHVLIITSTSSSILQILVPMGTKKVSSLKFLQLNTDVCLAWTLQILQLAIDKSVGVTATYFYVNHTDENETVSPDPSWANSFQLFHL